MPADAVAGGTSGGRQPAVDSTERRSAFLTLALVCRLQAAAIGHADGADEVFSRHRGKIDFRPINPGVSTAGAGDPSNTCLTATRLAPAANSVDHTMVDVLR